MEKATNYEKNICLLNDASWTSLRINEKIDVLQSIEDEIAKRERRLPCIVSADYMPSTEDSICLGKYRTLTKDIVINSEQLEVDSKYGNDYKVHVNTVLHEGRHAYQDQAVAGVIEHDDSVELEKWRDNITPGHYIEFLQNPKGYFNQPIESDARAYANKEFKQIENEKTQLNAKYLNGPKLMIDAKKEYLEYMLKNENQQVEISKAKATYVSNYNMNQYYEANTSNGSENERKNRR